MSNLKLATTSNKTYLNKRSKMKLLHLTKLGQWSSLIDTCVWDQLKPCKFARSAYETKNTHECPFRIWGNAWLMWQHVIYKQCSLYSTRSGKLINATFLLKWCLVMGIYVDALMEKNSLYLRFLFAEIINRGKNMGLDINDFNLTQCLLSACRIYMAARKVKNQS